MTATDEAEAIRVLVDGDACPVKALKVAARHRLPVVIVSNGGLRLARPMVRHVIVRIPTPPTTGSPAMRRRDIVVTAGVPLAARARKGAKALG